MRDYRNWKDEAMGIIDRVKDIFNFKKEDKTPEARFEQARESRLDGELQEALDHWNRLQEESPEFKPRVNIGRARVYILMGKSNPARRELMEFMEWYCQRESVDYNSTFFTIFISALQDLGYLEGDWPDKQQYLDNLAGSDITLDRSQVVDRIQQGLEILKEEGLWTEDLKLIKDNIARLIRIDGGQLD
ncbi:MAG: hypothetical protein ACOCZ3_03575 [Bacillota bacterium]